MLLDPAGFQAGQQAALENAGGFTGVVPPGFELIRCRIRVPGHVLGRGELLLGNLEVDPCFLPELKRKVGPALQPVLAQGLPQPGERRRQQRLAAAGQALVGP